MATGIAGKQLRLANYGTQVNRTAGNLPATTNAALFNVVGGRILLQSIVGLVTTVVQAQANTLSLTTLSTTGAVTTNLTAGIDITGAVVGNQYGITGVRTDAALLGSNVPTSNELCITVGSIRWATTATSTGAFSWSLLYIPLDDGAYVTAA